VPFRPFRRQKPAGYDGLATVADVRAAYRILLGRDPDPGGLANYSRLVSRGLTLERLRSIFLNSDEYRRRVGAESDVVEVDLGGYLVVCRASEPDFGQSIVEHARYEPHVCAAVSELLGEGQTCVDVGANIGCITLLAARLVGPEGTVVAIEPNPENLDLLYAGIVANGYANVRVLPYAASDRRAVFSLAGGASNTHLAAAGAGNHYAQSIVLDDLLADVPAVHLIKMDIEGYEPVALRGLVQTLERHRPILLTEFNPRCLRDIHGADPADYLRELASRYRRFRALTAFGDAVDLDDPEAVMHHWHLRDGEVSAQGLLPPGMLHFDLICTPG
jgi:FkbM family methyltransferase